MSRVAPALPGDLTKAYAETLPFPLDPFQTRACDALFEGDGVLVCAPTGAGKTVVGEFGMWAALQAGRRAFYTTPLKALSNQKFADLKARFGAERVGLLTGDNQINGDADLVVMTTEVLRNMLYERSDALKRLSVVVMDEVHYLADRSRGATWEEVLIHLPSDVRIAALSATVSNHEEFADWLRALRGDVASVVETHRPVPIEHRMLIEDQLLELLDEDGRGLDPRLARRLRERSRRTEQERRRGRRGPQRRPRLPRIDRTAAVSLLSDNGMLPAIVFVFSRAGCDKAVEELLRSRVRLTSREQRQQIDEIAAERLAGLDPNDHQILGVPRFMAALRNGIATHHAGMIPVMKETVEALFLRGLVSVVYATETLALGINMPARTVVIERLTKWNGQTHEPLTSTEFTQLTGRAGRRGIDVIGYGVVCEPEDITPEALAALAMQSASPLRSAFKPSYNMAVNLLGRMHAQEAEALIGRSFAQFIADRSVVSVEQRLARIRSFVANYREQLLCDCGDVEAWWRARKEHEEQLESQRRQRASEKRSLVRHALATSPPGRVLNVDGHLFIVTERRVSRTGEPSLLGLFDGTQMLRLRQDMVRSAPETLGMIELPDGSPMEARYQDEALSRVEQLPRPSERTAEETLPDLPETAVDACGKVKEHRHVCRQLDDALTEQARLEKRISRRSHALTRAFRGVCEILEQLGYIEDGEVTGRGDRLARIYTSSDLVVAEAIARGVFDGLAPAELAATCSALIHESRPTAGPPEEPPTRTVARSIDQLASIAEELQQLEAEARVELTGEVDGGLAASVYFWALGDDLEVVLGPTEIAAGDFVRSIKQLDDLLRQLAELEGTDPDLAARAREASACIRRGVVTAGASA